MVSSKLEIESEFPSPAVGVRLLLLPDEVCLAEDTRVVLSIIGHYSKSSYSKAGIQAQAFLTNYRVFGFSGVLISR